MATGNSGKIYIGAAVTPMSERRLLAGLVERLSTSGRDFRILANLELGGRQLDCAVALSDGVLVIEAKSSRLPVRGGVNGVWSRRDATGAWRAYPNAYQQALAAKLALRDRMAAFKDIGAHYPDGRVVFVPAIPDGSDLSVGDFKVALMSLEASLDAMPGAGSPWSLDDWDRFAQSLGLMEVSLKDAIAVDGGRAAPMKAYCTAFLHEYRPGGDRWIPERADAGEALLDAIGRSAGAYVWGPSGCGKSLAATWAAARLTERGGVVISLAAKDYGRAWSDLIRREVALLTETSVQTLMDAVRRTDTDLYLVVDGVNELPAGARRGFQALARRLDARLIVTGQAPPDPHLAGLEAIRFEAPSAALKARIAGRSGAALSAVAIEVLEAVASGMEADLVGQIGGELTGYETRPLLLDQYVRFRLGGHAREGAYGLRRFADRLLSAVAFSAAEVEFDGAMQGVGVGFKACDVMFESGLLVRRRGRVSFAHEMLFNACAASGLAEVATADPSGFAYRLSTPLLKSMAPDIVATMGDADACAALLAETTRPDLLAAAASGKLGSTAKLASDRLLSDAVAACRQEMATAQLELVSEGEHTLVRFASDTLRVWSAPEVAQLKAVGLLAGEIDGLIRYLDLCGEIDDRLRAERSRLARDAATVGFPLRSRLFALVYMGFGASVGFTHVARSDGPPPSREEAKLAGLRPDAKSASSGQLHLILEWRWAFFDSETEDCAEFLIEVFRDRFRTEPYHVQLAALSAVSFARNVGEEVRERLVAAIEGLDVPPENWAINTSVIDALKWLGALDDEAENARDGVRAEIEAAFAEDPVVASDLAYGLLTSMFDHPFDSIYGEEITGLEEPRIQQLYRSALASSRARQSWHLSWLIRKITALEQVSDGPLISPFAGLPNYKNSIPQEEWAAFGIATRFLGRHELELPTAQVTRQEDACLAEIRTLVHAAEAPRDARNGVGGQAWRALNEMSPQLVMGCVSEMNAALIEDFWLSDDPHYGRFDLVDIYPRECLALARRFVDAGLEAHYYHFVPHRERGPQLAFLIIERLGGAVDTDRLRQAARVHSFAPFAVETLRKLDSVAALRNSPP